MTIIGKDQLLKPKPLQSLSELHANTRLERDHFGPAPLILEPIRIVEQSTRHRGIPVLAEIFRCLVVMQDEGEDARWPA